MKFYNVFYLPIILSVVKFENTVFGVIIRKIETHFCCNLNNVKSRNLIFSKTKNNVNILERINKDYMLKFYNVFYLPIIL